ncbi:MULTISPECIES: hypothetical protein [Mesorhizobium]|uniref:hypothetical protein n=1 Tax=Mesorhizobium TaxID=68287 RepID=UPI00177DFFF6|nr:MULTISPECIES: hypothetical protein [Mesorhizobium]
MRSATISAALCVLLGSSAAFGEGIANLVVPRKDSLRSIEHFLVPLTKQAPSPLPQMEALGLDASLACPMDEAAWIDWRNASIPRLLAPKTNTAGVPFLDLQTMVQTADEQMIFLGQCSPTGTPQPLANFVAFVKNLGVMNYADHQFGFMIDDLTYVNAVRDKVELPPLLKSEDFLNALRNPSTYAVAKRLIDDHNSTLPADQQWRVLLYKSRFLATPDQASTFGRFFIYVPDGQHEKWIQFGIITPGETVRDINNVSIVSVGPPDPQGRRPSAIIDHWRTYNQDGSISLGTRYETVGATENCAMCHKTSPLGIHPAEEYLLNDKGQLVTNTINPGEVPEWLNDKIEEYGSPFFGDWLDVNNYGPSLGPRRDRTLESLRLCSAPEVLSDESLNKVKRAMRCESCHSDAVLGPINFPQPIRVQGFNANQVATFIAEGWMPPNVGAMLSVPERNGLLSCLRQEYHDLQSMTGLLVDWLKQVETP